MHKILLKENLVANKECCSQAWMHTALDLDYFFSVGMPTDLWDYWIAQTIPMPWQSLKVALRWIPLCERDLASRRRECNSNGLQCLSHLFPSARKRERTDYTVFNIFGGLFSGGVGFLCMLFLRSCMHIHSQGSQSEIWFSKHYEKLWKSS